MKTLKYIPVCSLLLFLLISGNVNAVGQYQERIFAQTDKQQYLAGEIIWFKIYTTDINSKPVAFSKVGYVEVVDNSTAQVQAKIAIQNGIGEGWLELPSTLSTGNYRFVAYTRYMQNEGESVFFNKQIGIINTFRKDKVELETAPANQIAEDSSIHNNITISLSSSSFKTRTPGEIVLEGLPTNIHSLSISITGNDFIPNRQDIREWQRQIKANTTEGFTSKYTPEYEGHIITAQLINTQSGQPEYSSSVQPFISFIGEKIALFAGRVDKDANVSFYTHQTSGTQELATTTYSTNNSTYRVDVQTPFITHSDKTLPPLKLNKRWETQLLQRTVGLQALYIYFADSLYRSEQPDVHFKSLPQKTYLLDEYTRFPTVNDVITEYIPDLRFQQINGKRRLSVFAEDRYGFSSGSWVFLDGILVNNHESIYEYNPYLIKKIEIYQGQYVFGGQIVDGIVSFTTYNHNYPGLKLDDVTQIFDYEGPLPHRYFYAPTYQSEIERQTPIPDYRHTLLWIPHLKHEGKNSLSIPFTTSDFTGEFKVTVQGMTIDGHGIDGVHSFVVEE